ncbi:MAG: YceI family protein [Polyangiaceae bacterium]|nr:YceI family protein [Polyangiaceae bacterium]
MTMTRRWMTMTFGMASAALGGIACERSQDPPPPTRVAPPAASSASAPAPSALRRTVSPEATTSFLIAAPLEKIQGKATRARGELVFEPANLDASRGRVELDLTTLTTFTFGDAEKDTKQTDHARNWLGLGPDVPAKEREENQWVRFEIREVKATPTRLADAPVVEGRRSVQLTANGELWLHGVTAKKSVRLAATFGGTPEAPTDVRVQSVEALRLSMKEHDVKPRDLAGKFLQGALERVGDKIVDEVQVSIQIMATGAPGR